MLPPGAILELKIYQNAFAAGAGELPLRELTALHRPRSWFLGVASRRAGENGKGRGGKKVGEGSFRPLFLQYNHWE